MTDRLAFEIAEVPRTPKLLKDAEPADRQQVERQPVGDLFRAATALEQRPNGSDNRRRPDVGRDAWPEVAQVVLHEEHRIAVLVERLQIGVDERPQLGTKAALAGECPIDVREQSEIALLE